MSCRKKSKKEKEMLNFLARVRGEERPTMPALPYLKIKRNILVSMISALILINIQCRPGQKIYYFPPQKSIDKQAYIWYNTSAKRKGKEI